MKQKITIDIEYGSEYQYETSEELWKIIIGAVEMHLEGRHRKNKLEYKIESVDVK